MQDTVKFVNNLSIIHHFSLKTELSQEFGIKVCIRFFRYDTNILVPGREFLRVGGGVVTGSNSSWQLLMLPGRHLET